jgi:hypothetical protein
MKRSLIVSIVIILLPITAFAMYKDSCIVNAKAKIAEPIFLVESINEKEDSYFYDNSIKEYCFKVKNNVNQRNSEVDFSYKILVEYSNSNFPVKCQLFNSKNEEILKGNNSTEYILVEKNKSYDEEYRLVVSWKDGENLSEKTDINIEVVALQMKE